MFFKCKDSCLHLLDTGSLNVAISNNIQIVWLKHILLMNYDYIKDRVNIPHGVPLILAIWYNIYLLFPSSSCYCKKRTYIELCFLSAIRIAWQEIYWRKKQKGWTYVIYNFNSISYIKNTIQLRYRRAHILFQKR